MGRSSTIRQDIIAAIDGPTSRLEILNRLCDVYGVRGNTARRFKVGNSLSVMLHKMCKEGAVRRIETGIYVRTGR